MHTVLNIHTSGRGFLDITQQVRDALVHMGSPSGLAHLFLQHTSASLVIQENADPDVLLDMEAWFSSQVPDGTRQYRHNMEGPDDMPAHIRTTLTHTDLTIPVLDGELLLGTWQAIYLYEHRTASHARRVVLTVLTHA